MKSLEGSGAPAREFWESDLEMALDHILEQSGQDGFIDEWIGRRTGRWKTQVKCDFTAGPRKLKGCSGNLYVQIAECNPKKRY